MTRVPGFQTVFSSEQAKLIVGLRLFDIGGHPITSGHLLVVALILIVSRYLAREAAFREKDIQIPFPQRDLHVKAAMGIVGEGRM